MIHGLATTNTWYPRSAEIERCTDFQVTQMKELLNDGCEFTSGNTCVSTLSIGVELANAVGTSFTYEWGFTPQAGITDNGIYTENIYTLYIDGDSDVNVDVHVTVTDEAGNIATSEGTFLVKHVEAGT